MTQWYENVPGVERSTLKLPPGAIVPESQPVASEVDVCGTLSVFVHRTVVPAVTVCGLAPNAFVPRNAAPEGIDTVDVGPPLVEGGAGVPGLGVGVTGFP